MESPASPNLFARLAGFLFFLGLFLVGALPSQGQQQNQIINFAGNIDQSLTSGRAVPDGAPVDGVISFVNSNTVVLSSNVTLTTYTNAKASVRFNVNGTNTLYQGFEASVDINAVDASGLSIPCSRLFITWGPGFVNSITIYSKITNYNNSAQIGITNTQWWANRLPYPIDHAIGISDTLAPLSAYGPPPALAITRTNGNDIISYPTNVLGYTLEAIPSLITNNSVMWQVVTNPAVVNGTNWNIIVSNNPPVLFFRLGTTN
jgi:hypothetical protein